MNDVDINHSYAVFSTFSVKPNINGTPCEDEPYIPFFLILVAAREMGYYPIRSHIESFLERIPSAADGGIYFSEFLQLCEELVGTRDLCMAAVHQFVYELESKKRSGVFTTTELLKILNPSACLMTQDEVVAVIRFLDPTKTGRVSLNTLAIALLRQQRPLGEMPCRDIILGSTNAQLAKDQHLEALSSELSKNSSDCNPPNAFQLSALSKYKASRLPITPSSHERGKFYKDEGNSEEGHSPQHSDFNSRVVLHTDLKTSPASKCHFTHIPTDMSVPVDPSMGSERSKRRSGVSNFEGSSNTQKLFPLNKTTTITSNNLNKDRMQDSSSMRRICDLSSAVPSPQSPSASKGKYNESSSMKVKNNRASCCVIC